MKSSLTAGGEDSIKYIEIKDYVENNNPHLLAIIESDLHGPNTNANRTTTFSTEEVKEKLHLDGYTIELPESWNEYHQARIIVYVSDKIRAKRRATSNTDYDLPSITLEIGLGREKKTLVNF